MAKKLEINTGDRFGKLTVIKEVKRILPSGAPTRTFVCKCDCGREITKDRHTIKSHPHCPYCKPEVKNVESLDGEIWLPVKDFESIYAISNKGRLKTLQRVVNAGRGLITRPEKLWNAQNNNPLNYYTVTLKDALSGKFRHVSIHRLVAEAFLPNPENKKCVDHINTDRHDNRVENLRWVTARENVNNPLSRSKMSKTQKSLVAEGKHLKSIRKVAQYDLNGNFIKEWNSLTEAGNALGIDISLMSKCCRNARHSCGGFRWEYIGERYTTNDNKLRIACNDRRD